MIDYGSRVLLSVLDFEAGERSADVGSVWAFRFELSQSVRVTATMVDINQRAWTSLRKNAEEESGVSAHIFQSNVYEKVKGIFTISSVIRLFVLVSKSYTQKSSAEAMLTARRRFDPCDPEEARSAQCQVEDGSCLR